MNDFNLVDEFEPDYDLETINTYVEQIYERKYGEEKRRNYYRLIYKKTDLLLFYIQAYSLWKYDQPAFESNLHLYSFRHGDEPLTLDIKTYYSNKTFKDPHFKKLKDYQMESMYNIIDKFGSIGIEYLQSAIFYYPFSQTLINEKPHSKNQDDFLEGIPTETLKSFFKSQINEFDENNVIQHWITDDTSRKILSLRMKHDYYRK